MTRAATIARHLNAFLEALGGAAVAGEAAGPWVVKTRNGWESVDAGDPLTKSLATARQFPTRALADKAAAEWPPVAAATVLPLAEAERMEAAAKLASAPAHTQHAHPFVAAASTPEPPKPAAAKPGRTLSMCRVCDAPGWRRLDGIDGPDAICPKCATDPTALDWLRNDDEYPNVRLRPEPPKPAGWVVRATHPTHGTAHVVDAGGGTGDDHSKAHVFGDRTIATDTARSRSWGAWVVSILPVDAAGNAIEALPGVAWEAARAGEEVERLRADIELFQRAMSQAEQTRRDLAAEVARLRAVLGSIATLDESDTDDLTEALTNWDVADVYAGLRAAITSARMALDDAAKGAGRYRG